MAEDKQVLNYYGGIEAMKAVIRMEDQLTGVPCGDVDLLRVEEYCKEIRILGVYDGRDTHHEVVAQINLDAGVLEFIVDCSDDS